LYLSASEIFVTGKWAITPMVLACLDAAIFRSYIRPIEFRPTTWTWAQSGPADDLSKTSMEDGAARSRSDDDIYIRKGSRMSTGTVKWFNAQKGFGFIQPDDGGNDIFVHISAVERAGMHNLAEGQKISYEVKRNPKNGKDAAENLQAA
jgi:cold shock protein